LQQAGQALQQRLFVALHFCNDELQKYRTAWRALHEIANSLEQHSGKLRVALRQIVTGTSQTLVPNAFDAHPDVTLVALVDLPHAEAFAKEHVMSNRTSCALHFSASRGRLPALPGECQNLRARRPRRFVGAHPVTLTRER